MQHSNVYITIDSAAIKSQRRCYGYVMECEINGETKTLEGFGEIEATYNAATLTAIIAALKRFKRQCEIDLYCSNTFINNMIQNNLQKWAENSFKTKKGDSIANAELWEELWPLYTKHMINTVAGTHSYTEWLLGTMKGEKQ